MPFCGTRGEVSRGRKEGEVTKISVIWYGSDTSVIILHGQFTLGEGATALRNAVSESLKDGRNKIVLNLRDVSKFDSSGVGSLVGSCNQVLAAKGIFLISSCSSETEKFFWEIRLDHFFTFCASDREALARILASSS